MEDQELARRLLEIEKKLDLTFASAEKTRKIMLWTAIVGAALVILPMIGLVFAIPSFLSTYSTIGTM